MTPLPPDIPEIVSMPSRFEKKQESGFIDVWWLYDDGGEPVTRTLTCNLVATLFRISHSASFLAVT